MNNVHEIMDLWHIKTIFGIILMIVSPIQTIIIIIFFMVLLDTITGVTSAIKLKRFNSKTFKKNLKKMLVYATCILTVRLVEIGALAYVDTFVLTKVVAGFLIVTEALSIIENLIILGLPFPNNFLNIFFKQIRVGIFEDILSTTYEEQEDLKDIKDMLYFQIPFIKSQNLRKILQIKFDVWLQVAKNLTSYFESDHEKDNELIYYKVMSIIQTGLKEIQHNLVEENLSKECIQKFNKRHEKRLNRWLYEVKDICYNISPPKKKKDELIKKLTILLYQTILDAQKSENGICIKKKKIINNKFSKKSKHLKLKR